MHTSDYIGWFFVAAGVMILAIFLLGCAPARLTTETRWPGEPDLIVVEWPEGTTELDEIEVHDVDGRLQIVGPYRPETVY